MSIYISYRRDETSGYAGRLYDGLAANFGRSNVFLDAEASEPGIDFIEAIDQAIASCGVLVLLIGSGWLTAVDATGRPRLENPNDFVHLEIASALRRDLPIFPVLLDGASMPTEEQLPRDIAPLARLCGHELSTSRWDFDVARLLDQLERVMEPATTRHMPESAAAPEPASVARSRGVIGSLTELAGEVASAVGGVAASIGEALKSSRKKRTEHKAVDFAAFGPEVIAPDSHAIVDIWAYPFGEFRDVVRLASEVDRGHQLGRKVGLDVELGTLITVELILGGLVVDPTAGSLFWGGVPTNVSFVIHAPKGAEPGTFHGSATMRIDGIKLGELALVVRVDHRAAGELTWHPQAGHRVRTAFASYASDDREQVFARLQGIRKASPQMEIFVDVATLRSGEDWEEKLAKEVPSKDIFYLFWSKAASSSEWVTREWEIAFNKRGLNYIDPVPLQDPRDLEIPGRLRQLHFNDAYLIHAEYERLRKQLKGPE